MSSGYCDSLARPCPGPRASAAARRLSLSPLRGGGCAAAFSQPDWQAAGLMCIHILSPKSCQNVSRFFYQTFPVLALTSGDKECIRNGKYSPRFLYQNFLRFRYPFYPRFRYPFYPPFPIPFLSPFRIPFLAPFSRPFFAPVSDTLFIPVSDTLFIPVSDTRFCSRPFRPFLPPPPMQPCAHVRCPVHNVRTGHNSEQLECIPHL